VKATPRSGTGFRFPGFRQPHPRSFYDRPTVSVAKDLLGSYLVHRTNSVDRVARIVEVEAYVKGDPANHAFRGPTHRNRSMFASPGTLYVYRIHQVVCANAVTRRGEAILLRSGEPISPRLAATIGPGRLARALGIIHRHDGLSLIRSEVRIVPDEPTRYDIVSTRRVGVRQAADRRLRFLIRSSEFVSRRR
jgi:DNA-3-methyladenine glycosylase